MAQDQSSTGNRREAKRNDARNLATAQSEQQQQFYNNNARPTVRPGSDVPNNKPMPTKKPGFGSGPKPYPMPTFRDTSSMGNRLAPQKEAKSTDEEMKRKARERAMMRRLS
tara:strand:- start:542 stop:874 length:333 start_codon:yes stop_codon:yes gene_type:complete